MKIGLISQIRNEIDILEPFPRHIDVFFDRAYLLNHRSADGSDKILKHAASQKPGWEYFNLDFAGNFQQKVANTFMKKAFSEGVDFLFILDADEFLRFPDRRSLEGKLHFLDENNSLGKLVWRNCAPVTFEDVSFNKFSPIFLSPHHSTFSKVVISRKCFLSDPQIKLSKGNHEILNRENKNIPKIGIGEILHIPIRSENQIICKAIITQIANSLNKSLPLGASFQYSEFLSKIALGSIDKADLLRFVHIYESPRSRYMDIEEVINYWESAKQTSLKELNIGHSSGLILNTLNERKNFYSIIADALINIKNNQPDEFDLIVTDGAVNIKAIKTPENDKVINNLEIVSAKTDEITKAIDAQQNSLISYLETELEKSQQEVMFYANSKSWHITKPLRMAMDFFRKVKSDR